MRITFQTAIACLLAVVIGRVGQADIVVDFETFPLPSSGYVNGPADNAVEVTTEHSWGSNTSMVGAFNVNGVGFGNNYSNLYGSWSGFAISNHNNTTEAGYLNQYSVYGTGGVNGSSNFAVAYGYHDTAEQLAALPELAFDPTNADHLLGLPSIYIPSGYQVAHTWISNTTYAALSMLEGDSFTGSPFGGEDGTRVDHMTLNIFGLDEFGIAIPESIEVILGNFNYDSSLPYGVIEGWNWVDLSPLQDASSLHFNITSTAFNDYGLTVPAYFALDNLTLTAVPEPTSLALLGTLVIGYGVRRRMRGRGRSGS